MPRVDELRPWLPAGAVAYVVVRPAVLLRAAAALNARVEPEEADWVGEALAEWGGEPLAALAMPGGWVEAGLDPAAPLLVAVDWLRPDELEAVRWLLKQVAEGEASDGELVARCGPRRVRLVGRVADGVLASRFARRLADGEALARVAEGVLVVDTGWGGEGMATRPPLRPERPAPPEALPPGGAAAEARVWVEELARGDVHSALARGCAAVLRSAGDPAERARTALSAASSCEGAWSAAEPTFRRLDLRLEPRPEGAVLVADLALTRTGERAWTAALAEEPWEPELPEPALVVRLRFDWLAGAAAAGPPLLTSAGGALCPDLDGLGALVFWPQVLARREPGPADRLRWLRPRTASLSLVPAEDGFEGRVALRVARPPDAVRRFLARFDVTVPEDGTGVMELPFGSHPVGVRVDGVDGGARVAFSAGTAPGGPEGAVVAPPGLVAGAFLHAGRLRDLLEGLDFVGPLPDVLEPFERWVESLAVEVRVRRGRVRGVVRVRWAQRR